MDYSKRLEEYCLSRGGQLLSPYVNSRTKVLIKCNIGHEFYVGPTSLIHQQSWCKECCNTSRSKAIQRLYEVVESKGGIVLGEYKGNKIDIAIQCDKGHVFNARPNNITSGRGSWCSICSNNNTYMAYNNMLDIIKEHGGELISGQEYKNNKTHVKVRCKYGHEWNVRPDQLVKGTWCPRCANKSSDQTHERFLEIVESNAWNIIEGQYINAYSNFLIQCNNGHIWNTSAHNIIYSNTGCIYCNKQGKEYGYAQLSRIVHERGGIILDEYVNNKTKIRFQCKEGHIFYTKPTTIVNDGCFCPICNESHGEREIRLYLEKHNIWYLREWIPEGYTPIKYRYDFLIYYNGIYKLIEYDGEQHFRYVEHFHKILDKYHDRVRKDYDKTLLAINNGLSLLRISYIDKDRIHELLDRFLNDNNVRVIYSNRELYHGTWKDI